MNRSLTNLTTALISSWLLTTTLLAQAFPGFEGLTRDLPPPPQAPVGSTSDLYTEFQKLPSFCETEGCNRGGIRLLAEGPEAWAARWALMKNARKSIDLTYYIMSDDIFGMSMIGHLIQKASEGVKVRMLIDATGSPGFKLAGEGGMDILQELVATGNAEVKLYVPMHEGLKLAVKDRDVLKGIASNHDKILVADGEWAITGGRNIGEDYFTSGADHGTGYRDTDVLIHSAGASAGLLHAMQIEWDVERNKTIAEERLNVISRRNRMIGYYTMMDQWMASAKLSPEQAEAERTEAAYQARVETLSSEMDAFTSRGSLRVVTNAYTAKKAKAHMEQLAKYLDLKGLGAYNPEEAIDTEGELRIIDKVSRANATGYDTLNAALVAFLAAAREDIWIANPYVVVVDKALDAMQVAGENGARINILTNSPASTDSLVTQAYFVQQWPSLMAMVPGMRIHVMNGERKLHAKTATFDGKLTLVGTYNMDLLSARTNSEVSVAIWSDEFAAQQTANIQADIVADYSDTQEYRIARDPSTGAAVLGEDCRPVVEFGPEHHIAPDRMSKMKATSLKVMERLARRTSNLPSMRQLMRMPGGESACGQTE